MLTALIATLLGPVVQRPTGATIEVTGAEFAWTTPESSVLTGVPSLGSIAFPATDGLIRFRTDRLTDYIVTVALPGLDDDDPETPDYIYHDFLIHSTREHRIEHAVKLQTEAMRIFNAENANFFDIEAANQRVNSEENQ